MIGSKPRLKVFIYITFLEKVAQLIGYNFLKDFRQEGLLNYGLIELDYAKVVLDVQFWHLTIEQGQVCGYNNE